MKGRFICIDIGVLGSGDKSLVFRKKRERDESGPSRKLELNGSEVERTLSTYCTMV